MQLSQCRQPVCTLLQSIHPQTLSSPDSQSHPRTHSLPRPKETTRSREAATSAAIMGSCACQRYPCAPVRIPAEVRGGTYLCHLKATGQLGRAG